MQESNSRLAAARVEVEAALVMLTELEFRPAPRVAPDAESIAEQRRRTAVLDANVDKLVAMIAGFIARMPPPTRAQ